MVVASYFTSAYLTRHYQSVFRTAPVTIYDAGFHLHIAVSIITSFIKFG